MAELDRRSGPATGSKRPEPSSPSASRRMARQKNRDTQIELALRSELHRRGLRFRVHRRVLPNLRREHDIVFVKRQVVVEVRGCFWHSCPVHATRPNANSAWWANKLATNRARDERAEQALTEEGWTLVVVWEHQSTTEAADAVEAVVRRVVP